MSEIDFLLAMATYFSNYWLSLANIFQNVLGKIVFILILNNEPLYMGSE